MKIVAVLVVSALGAWIVLVAVLALARPKGMNFRAAMALVPDIVRLLRGLAGDPSTSRGVRIRLGMLLIYLASPIDLVPDFVPVLGYADDLVAVSLVLRSVVRRSGVDALRRHWTGSPEGFELVLRLAGLASSGGRHEEPS